MLKTKKKVADVFDLAIDARMLGASGIGVYLEKLIIELGRRTNYKIVLLVFDEYTNYFESRTSMQFKYIALKTKIYNPIENIELSIKIPKCKIYWTPHFNSTFLPTRARKRLTTIHDVFHLTEYASFGFLGLLYLKFRYMASSILSDKIITVSHFSRDEVLKYFGRKAFTKSQAIHNGYEKYLGESSSRNIERSNNKLLFVGNVKPHKNLSVLIDAFEELNKQIDIKLIIVGKIDGFISPLSQTILSRIKANRNIMLTGYVSNQELEYYYKTATIFVFPSIYEGFGLPILEAYNYELPTIVSNIPPCREVADSASLYFDPNSKIDLKQKIVTLLNSIKERGRLVERGKERLKYFSWAKSAEKHIEIITALLKNEVGN